MKHIRISMARQDARSSVQKAGTGRLPGPAQTGRALTGALAKVAKGRPPPITQADPGSLRALIVQQRARQQTVPTVLQRVVYPQTVPPKLAYPQTAPPNRTPNRTPEAYPKKGRPQPDTKGNKRTQREVATAGLTL